jgi:hypothetical protein
MIVETIEDESTPTMRELLTASSSCPRCGWRPVGAGGAGGLFPRAGVINIALEGAMLAGVHGERRDMRRESRRACAGTRVAIAAIHAVACVVQGRSSREWYGDQHSDVRCRGSERAVSLSGSTPQLPKNN